jgi:hypothetical protein
MNKRIKELHSKVISESENMRWNIEDSKKLVELVVQECISALDNADGSVHHSKCLLEHFGFDNETH